MMELARLTGSVEVATECDVVLRVKVGEELAERVVVFEEVRLLDDTRTLLDDAGTLLGDTQSLLEDTGTLLRDTARRYPDIARRRKIESSLHQVGSRDHRTSASIGTRASRPRSVLP